MVLRSRRTLVVIAWLVLVVAAGVSGSTPPTSNPPAGGPGSATGRLPSGPGSVGGPGQAGGVTPSPSIVPTGRAVDSVAEFDRAPCAVATIEELLGALAPAYDIITGTTLRPEGTPAGSTFPARMPEAAACRFALAATNTDSAEAFHSVTVTVTRWRDGGSGLLGTCQTAAMAQPARYPAVRLGDEACLGPGALLPIRLDARYYTVGVTARPGHADATDDDLRIGTLTRAAAEVVATRLPRT